MMLVIFLSSLPVFSHPPSETENQPDQAVKAVLFEGNNYLSAVLLGFMVKVKPRFTTNESEIQADLEHLQQTGFFEQVSCSRQGLDKKITVTFTLQEKSDLPVYFVGTISTQGNIETRSDVILREIHFTEGDQLDLNKLEHNLLELEKFRIFKKIVLRMIPGRDNIAQLIVEVEEGMHHVGFVFPTYSSDNPDLWGVGPIGGYINLNFRGTGSWIGLGGMWAKNRVLLAGMYFPRLLGTEQDLSLGFGYGEREQETFSKTFSKTGGEFKINIAAAIAYWNIPLTNNLKVLHFIGFISNSFDQISGKIPSLDAWGPLYSATIAYDSRDDELEPRSGWYPGLRFDVGYYVDENNVQSNYIRYNPTLKRYFNLGRGHSLALQVRGGVTNKDISYLGKYQLGGSNDLRGFPEWSIVGNNYFLSNLEYRFPLYLYRSQYGVTGVIFFDAGQAWDVGEQDFMAEIHVSKGIGLRFLMGPMVLRLDYGFSDQTEGIYFYFGHLF